MALSKEQEERLRPKHLTTDEEKEEVTKKAEETLSVVAGEEKKDPEGDPKAQREYTFEFEWKDGRGKVWKGRFTNEVLSIHKRRLVGVLRAQLGNNIPVESLDTFTQEVNLILAHLSFSLIKKPKWADDLGEQDDVRLIQEIYSEVAEHEATFLGYNEAPETS